MDNQKAASGLPATEPAPEGLRRNSLNLPRLVFIGLAYFSLAPVIYLNMGFMETDSGGPVMPFLFIVITIAVLPTAISFALMNNRRPSAGSGYTWLWECTYPGVGLWLGWIMITTYVVVSALYPVAFGTFFNALLSYFHVTATTWTGIAGGIAAILIIGYLNHNNIKLSSTVIGVLMILEATFVAAVALVIVIRAGTWATSAPQPFDPRAATAGFTGLSLAAIFAFLSIAGVDGVAPVAEEARTTAPAHPARDDPHHGDRRAVLDPHLLRVRHRGAGEDRPGLRERRPDHAGAADLAVLHRRLGGAGADHRVHRRARQLRRVAVRRRAGSATRCPGKASCRATSRACIPGSAPRGGPRRQP